MDSSARTPRWCGACPTPNWFCCIRRPASITGRLLRRPGVAGLGRRPAHDRQSGSRSRRRIRDRPRSGRCRRRRSDSQSPGGRPGRHRAGARPAVTGTITGSLRFGRPYVPPARHGTALASGPFSLDVQGGTVRPGGPSDRGPDWRAPRGRTGSPTTRSSIPMRCCPRPGITAEIGWPCCGNRAPAGSPAYARPTVVSGSSRQRHGDTLRCSARLADLFPTGGPPRQLDEDFLGDMFANRMTTYDRTPFVGLWRLPAGHLLEADAAGAVRVRRWYHPAVAPLRVDHETAVRELRTRLDTVLGDHADPAGAGCWSAVALTPRGYSACPSRGASRRLRTDLPRGAARRVALA